MQNETPVYNKEDLKRRFSAAFKTRPPVEAIQIHGGPPRPDVFVEVKFGPYVSETDANIAYQVWSLPDEILGQEWRARADHPFPAPPKEVYRVPFALARNVYEHLMLDPLIPVSQEDAEATKSKAIERGEFWNTAELIAPWRDDIIRQSTIHSVKSWTAESIRSELKERGLRSTGSRNILEACLIQDEIERHCGIMPRSDLSHWSIDRSDKYSLQPATKENMSALDMYTFAIHLNPYNPAYWVSRAYCHYQHAFFDLALGDSWRAKLLCDVLMNFRERSRQPGLYTRVWHAIEQHLLASFRSIEEEPESQIYVMRDLGAVHFIPSLLQAVDNIMDLSMIAQACWRDYSPKGLPYRSEQATEYRDTIAPVMRKDVVGDIEKLYGQHMDRQKLFWYEQLQGWSPANRKYPYEANDVQRTEQTFLDTLNLNLFQIEPDGPGDIPVEVRESPSISDGGLGVFVTDDIKKGVLIYYEEPTIRGHLPPRRMKLDKSQPDERRCEHCHMVVHTDSLIDEDVCACVEHWTHSPGTPGLVFCPTIGPRSCLNIARELHHFGSCGKNWNWLYDSMRPNVMDYYGLEHLARSNENLGTVLSLLLRNVFEITIQRREKNPSLSPHEIDELLVLEGDGRSWRDSWFPFLMAGNITVPFDILTVLGVDIFRDLSFDTWVIQIVLRKLLTNVIPWDKQRRGRVPDILFTDQDKEPEHPDDQDSRIKKRLSFKDWDPSFPNLYLFPGLSMFNHSCRDTHNAEWGYDTMIPNRIVVWAARDIQKGEEIRIRYRHGTIQTRNHAIRYFGGMCLCPTCENIPESGSHARDTDSTDETDGTDILALSESEDAEDVKQGKRRQMEEMEQIRTEMAGDPEASSHSDQSGSTQYHSWPCKKAKPRSIDLIQVEMGQEIHHNGVKRRACRRRKPVSKTWRETPNPRIVREMEKEARKPGQTQEEFKAEFEAVRERWKKKYQQQQRDKEITAKVQDMRIIS